MGIFLGTEEKGKKLKTQQLIEDAIYEVRWEVEFAHDTTALAIKM